MMLAYYVIWIAANLHVHNLPVLSYTVHLYNDVDLAMSFVTWYERHYTIINILANYFFCSFV